MLLFVVWLLRLFVLSEVVGTVVGAGAVLSIGGEWSRVSEAWPIK